MRPLQRGYVKAKSNQPEDMPLINPRYQSEETDRMALLGSLRFARRMFEAPALKPYVLAESLPGKDVRTDDELLDYARRYGGTCYHASCTCMMGQHPSAVVDDQLRVHGMEGLRVIDASAEKGAVMDQGGRARAAGVLRVIGRVSQGEFEILYLAMGASYDP